MNTSLVRPILGGLFVAAVGYYVNTVFGDLNNHHLLVIASMIGAYMALNIGANDVANNVGAAVGSFALSLGAAIAIAAFFEAAGALIAGGDVIKTVKKGIIDPSVLETDQIYIWVMMAALLGGAIWLNVATALGAPVSTTHSIVGGVMGAAIAAAGWGAVNWESMGAIAASWVISPVMGGVIAASILMLLQRKVFFQEDLLGSAARIVPILIALMAWAFTTYLALKGVKKIVKIDFIPALGIGGAVAVASYFILAPKIRSKLSQLKNEREDVNSLFTIPLIFGAALLCFAHGANDVANAIGPLAGIFDALNTAGISGKVAIPWWIMLIGALGLSIGLALFGPKLIRTVGSEITELDRARAFCITIAAAITVIIASQLGLPISSTHVALGAVFGVGFLREYLDSQLSKSIEDILQDRNREGHFALEARLHHFYDAAPEEKEEALRELKQMGKSGMLTRQEAKKLRKLFKRNLVKRQAFVKIVSAWLITVPISATLAAGFFFMLRGMMLP